MTNWQIVFAPRKFKIRSCHLPSRAKLGLGLTMPHFEDYAKQKTPLSFFRETGVFVQSLQCSLLLPWLDETYCLLNCCPTFLNWLKKTSSERIVKEFLFEDFLYHRRSDIPLCPLEIDKDKREKRMKHHIFQRVAMSRWTDCKNTDFNGIVKKFPHEVRHVSSFVDCDSGIRNEMKM